MFRSVVRSIEREEQWLQSRLVCHWANRGLALGIWIFCLFVLFHDLGAAALFEPDEGRNAEKAREILLLNDWVTPHENFLPVLDKPIFFYWLIAFSFKLFGFSEWAARLPSVLAALGCLIVIYRFASKHWGQEEALWSTLILITSAEFFILSRVVIFDMTLTFFITLALCSFFTATRIEDARSRRYYCLLMYGAIAAGTLIKGPVALLIPGMIIFFYLLFSKEWPMGRQLHIGLGISLFLLTVLPAYLWIETRNPGYLEYFFWEENFGRFLTSRFDRSHPWYYFFGVLFVGLLPWSFLVPLAAKNHWKRPLERKSLFVILWAVSPFVLFSISRAKLPHYILPVFAPLSIMIARAMVARLADSTASKKWLLYTPWVVQIAVVAYLTLGSVWPAVLPNQIRQSVGQMAPLLWVIGLALFFIYAGFCFAGGRGYWNGQRSIYWVHCLGAGLFLTLMVEMMAATSAERSAKPVVEKVARSIDSGAQIVFYDTYLAGTPFYLRAERPVWIVTHADKKKTVLGNYYANNRRARPETPYGKALYTFDEFREIWSESKRPLLVIVKQKNLRRMEHEINASPKELSRVDEYVLVTNQKPGHLANMVDVSSSEMPEARAQTEAARSIGRRLSVREDQPLATRKPARRDDG